MAANFANSCEKKLLLTCSWLYQNQESGNSQSRQILPAGSWANFAAIDFFVAIYEPGKLPIAADVANGSLGDIC